MVGWIAVLLAILGAFLGGTIAENQTQATLPTVDMTPVASESSSCTTPVSENDVRDALAVGGNTFSSTLWTVSTTDGVYPYETTVTWLSNRLSAVAYLEYLHYDCGVRQQDIDQWVMPNRFDIVFANFGSYEQTATCQRNGVLLFEFSVLTTSGQHDHALYWVKQVSPTRVAAFNLVVPEYYQAKQTAYARALFPELATCSEE